MSEELITVATVHLACRIARSHENMKPHQSSRKSCANPPRTSSQPTIVKFTVNLLLVKTELSSLHKSKKCCSTASTNTTRTSKWVPDPSAGLGSWQVGNYEIWSLRVFGGIGDAAKETLVALHNLSNGMHRNRSRVLFRTFGIKIDSSVQLRWSTNRTRTRQWTARPSGPLIAMSCVLLSRIFSHKLMYDKPPSDTLPSIFPWP